MSKGKALSLLSGGLDSLLATRLIMDQGIEVTGICFITPFFGYEKKGQEAHFEEGLKHHYGIQGKIIDVGEEYFQILLHPRYGYGKNFNPCIDCKIFLFSRAKALLEKEQADFLVTGEVLGQRPLSQRRDTLRIVERDSETEGILLRPLSAKNLKPTRPELTGLVDREKLLSLKGRSRKPQMKLADEMGFRHYPSPAGGCLLTDPVLSGRFRKYCQQSPEVSIDEILLLQVGRHFQLPGGSRLVVGRRDEENQKLIKLRRKGDVLLKLYGIPGPLGLVRGKSDEPILSLAASIVARYSKAKEADRVEVLYGREVDFSGHLFVKPAEDPQIAPFRF